MPRLFLWLCFEVIITIYYEFISISHLNHNITFLNNLEIVKKEEISQDEPSIGSINKSAIPKKMKRNEPCFCGSGKKYKHCCGAL